MAHMLLISDLYAFCSCLFQTRFWMIFVRNKYSEKSTVRYKFPLFIFFITFVGKFVLSLPFFESYTDFRLVGHFLRSLERYKKRFHQLKVIRFVIIGQNVARAFNENQ